MNFTSRAIDQGCKRLGFNRLGLYLLDADSGTMTGTYGIDTDGKLRPEKDSIFHSEEEPWLHDFLHIKDRLLISEDEDLYEGHEIVGHGWHITAAMWIRNTPIGLLFADNLTNQDPLQPHQPELLSGYATTLAHLLERKRADIERERLLQQTQQQAESLALLNEMSTKLNQAITLDEIYQAACDYTVKIMDGARASITFIQPNRHSFEVIGLSGRTGTIPLGTTMPIEGTGVGLCWREKRQLYFPEEASLETYSDTQKNGRRRITGYYPHSSTYGRSSRRQPERS